MNKCIVTLLCIACVSIVAAEGGLDCQGITKPGVLKSGSRSANVLLLQKFLNADPDTQIASSGAGSPGNETQLFGAKTALAVKRFQEKYRAEVLVPAGISRPTGQVGAMTKKKMQSLCVAGFLTGGVAPESTYEESSSSQTGADPISFQQNILSASGGSLLFGSSGFTKSPLAKAVGIITGMSAGVPTSTQATTSLRGAPLPAGGVSKTPAVSGSPMVTDKPYIASPKSGEVYRSQFTISVVIAAQEPSSKVVLLIDGKPVKSQTVTSTNQRIFVLSTEAALLSFGTHSLSAYVTNLKGKVTTTSLVTIEVLRTSTAPVSSGGGGGGSAIPSALPVDGVCGSLHGSIITTVLPVDGFCAKGVLGGVTGSGPWQWTCAGENGGVVAQCGADVPSIATTTPVSVVPPVCGASHGVPQPTNPSFNLCAVGEESKVTGTGPYNWTCSTSPQSVVACQSPKLAPTGTTYYLSDCQIGAAPGCVAGTSTNTGLSAQSPKRTVAEIPALKKGETIRFAKGGSWINVSMRFRATPATREDPFVFESYDTPWGGSQKPILAGTSIFSFDDAGALDSTGAAFNDGGYIIRNLTLRGGTTFQNPAGGGNAVFISRRVHDVTMENLDISGFAIGVFSTIIDNTNITLRDSVIHDNTKFGWLGGGTNVVIENTTFDRNGSQPVFDHNLYMSYVDNAIIRGNTLTKNTLNAAGSCVGTIFVVHGTASNMLIEDNYLYEENASGGCYGIEISPGYAANVGMESFSNNIIRNNNVVNVGYIGIGARNCFNCTIENNNIVWTKNTGMIGISMGVNVPGAEDDQKSKLIIRNNSIYTNSTAMTYGIAMLPLGGDHVISSNMLYFGANTPSATVKCFDIGTSTRSSFQMFDNNACYRQGTSPKYSNTYSSLPLAQDNNFDVHAVTTDPGLTAVPNASSYLIRTSSVSPLIDSGSSLYHSIKDYLNVVRGSLPDIGAFEYVQ
jgi:peptidoglycan hydrolase-like protein with peptidoglycan-binding domain